MPRGTRKLILDHIDSARNMAARCLGQLEIAADLGKERSPPCAMYIPEIMNAQIGILELIENVRKMI